MLASLFLKTAITSLAILVASVRVGLVTLVCNVNVFVEGQVEIHQITGNLNFNFEVDFSRAKNLYISPKPLKTLAHH
jgi:hypothetical protein